MLCYLIARLFPVLSSKAPVCEEKKKNKKTKRKEKHPAKGCKELFLVPFIRG